MKYVRYIGLAHRRQISASDWQRAGFSDAETVQWDASNGFMVPADKFTDEQLRKAIVPDPGFIMYETDSDASPDAVPTELTGADARTYQPIDMEAALPNTELADEKA